MAAPNERPFDLVVGGGGAKDAACDAAGPSSASAEPTHGSLPHLERHDFRRVRSASRDDAPAA